MSPETKFKRVQMDETYILGSYAWAVRFQILGWLLEFAEENLPLTLYGSVERECKLEYVFAKLRGLLVLFSEWLLGGTCLITELIEMIGASPSKLVYTLIF